MYNNKPSFKFQRTSIIQPCMVLNFLNILLSHHSLSTKNSPSLWNILSSHVRHIIIGSTLACMNESISTLWACAFNQVSDFCSLTKKTNQYQLFKFFLDSLPDQWKVLSSNKKNISEICQPASFAMLVKKSKYKILILPQIFKGASNSSKMGWLRKISLDFKQRPRISDSVSCTFFPGLDPLTVKHSKLDW